MNPNWPPQNFQNVSYPPQRFASNNFPFHPTSCPPPLPSNNPPLHLMRPPPPPSQPMFPNAPNYPPANNFQAPPPNIIQPVLSQEESDKQWLKTWIESLPKPLDTPEEKSSSITILDMKSRLEEAFKQLDELKSDKAKLESVLHSDDDGMWNFVHRRVLRTKERKKKQRKILKVEKEEKQRESQKIAEKIDAWLENEKEKVEQEKREKLLKEEADSILGEVRRKIQEMKRTKEKLTLLQKLRGVRKESFQSKSLFTPPEADTSFQSQLTSMMGLVSQQLEQYISEEKAMKAMLETDRENKREVQNTLKQKQMEAIFNTKSQRILEALFGSQEVPTPDNPLFPFYMYYNHPSTSLERFMATSKEWDAFLVPCQDPTGSSIPLKWVVPPAPSSDEWKKYLKTKL